MSLASLPSANSVTSNPSGARRPGAAGAWAGAGAGRSSNRLTRAQATRIRGFFRGVDSGRFVECPGRPGVIYSGQVPAAGPSGRTAVGNGSLPSRLRPGTARRPFPTESAIIATAGAERDTHYVPFRSPPMATQPVEVVFSFDTTGSMYPCLTQ